ncbi:MAG: hypothetical protein LBV76_02760 [Deltaproteobacteria bacterium]|jgi:hypothetical protein|nr:hypothetical protein [Deltaproteobacteria bacterium]
MQDHYKKVSFVLPLLCLLFLAGCSSRVSTQDIRSGLNSGHQDELIGKLQAAHESHNEFVTALNLARVYQLQGSWRESITAYAEALYILEEYEQRAVINMRGILGEAGSILVSRGSKGYFGTGYERTLLHTFNALNYLMLHDFSGAMVEMRKMELRQELWLAEEEQRLQEHLEKLRTTKSENSDDLGRLPASYSMTALLNDPRTKAIARAYQDAFSYALSAVVGRLAGDTEYAKISLRRAALLDQNAYALFSAAWGKGKMIAGQWEPEIPALSSDQASTGQASSGQALAGGALMRMLNSYGFDTGYSLSKSRQEVSIIVLCGLAPALRMEQIRIPAPYVGYLMLELPAYIPPRQSGTPLAESSTRQPIAMQALLHTDFLAYRTLRDELRYEIGYAVTRAITRAAIAGTAYALASSNDKTQGAAPLIGYMATGIMDLLATGTSQNVRNWELLPATGYLAQGYVQSGESVRIQIEQSSVKIDLPQQAKGVIILVSYATKDNMRVDYVAY